jgi:hypothetical protein
VLDELVPEAGAALVAPEVAVPELPLLPEVPDADPDPLAPLL